MQDTDLDMRDLFLEWVEANGYDQMLRMFVETENDRPPRWLQCPNCNSPRYVTVYGNAGLYCPHCRGIYQRMDMTIP